MMDGSYCGRQMKVLYDSGWYAGEVKYYNDHLQKYLLKLDDNSEDYIGDGDMVEVCYLVSVIGFICEVLELIFCSKIVIYFLLKLRLYPEDAYTAFV